MKNHVTINMNVLFITTKNLDYIRNTQEIGLLRDNASSITIIGSNSTNYLMRVITVYAKLLVQRMADINVVFIGFAPQLILPIWRWKFRKRSIVIDFFISMYDTLVNDRKKVDSNSLMAKILHRWDAITLKNVDKVIVDTKAHGDFFCKEFGANFDKIEVLYLEADKKIYYPRPQVKPKEIEGKFVVLYFGSVLPLQGVDIVLKAIELLKNKKQIFFYVVGPVDLKLEGYQGETVEYINWLSQNELADYIARADLCLAGHFSKGIEKAKRTIPGKAYIYSAMNKKMILGDNPANHELYEENERTYFVEMGDACALASKIVEIEEKCL